MLKRNLFSGTKMQIRSIKHGAFPDPITLHCLACLIKHLLFSLKFPSTHLGNQIISASVSYPVS